MMISVWLVLLYTHITSANINNVSYTIRIYSNLAEIIRPLDKLPLEFADDDWNHIRSDSITLFGENVNIKLQTITEQKKALNGTEVYVRSPISSDAAIKLIKGILIDEVNNLVKIHDESIVGQQALFITVPYNQIYYLEEPTKPKHYVNFTYTASDSNLFVSYLQSNLNWRTQYQLNLNHNESDLIAMANIRNDARSSVFIDQAELICGDINLQIHQIQYDRSFRKYRSGSESHNQQQANSMQTVFADTISPVIVEQGKELAGLYVFSIEQPFMINGKANYLLPMFHPQVSVERFGLISKTFSTMPMHGKAQRSYRLRSDRYLSHGNCIIREYDRVVGEISLPNLAANDKYEFSIGEDANIIYKENSVLISLSTFNETESMMKDSLEKNLPLGTAITRARYIYTIHLQVKNFKTHEVQIEYEQKGFHSYNTIKLITVDNDQFIQDGSSIKSNTTLQANTTENYIYTVELIR
ncbi:unnamed protein product [Rotaria magnacalcarata]|uniref:DUF4139 domain-containing protein n=1 Tax=Rotaria magnacalcarata TaxID=392030 RepID=A0A816PAY9_9BILA|nr:unnamed protein product [Rotaria magnacalcarata]CAF2046340.1 unnamed protein product [Rotaria magnacalcarata]CAF3823849.1 unnamed protein product [Rotaria magnacalcarata]CAF3837812.1 unnamed protein product [Rotaria magnacalcarata]